MSGKDILGALAVMLGMASSAVYIWGIYRGRVKPHVFTWLVYGLVTLIDFAAQRVENGGPGSWTMGMSALTDLTIAALALFCGEKDITRKDWLALVTALAAIPVWRMTENPLWAVVIVSMIDAVATYPTLRKSWIRPREEKALAFFVGGMQFLLSIFALENINLTTALYPAVIVFIYETLCVMLLYRRWALQ